MQLKLDLFEDSLDKYRRGKGFNQKLLATGKPKGTFKRGDPHPTVEGLFYLDYRKDSNRENWVVLSYLERREISDKIYRQKNKERIRKRDRERYKNDEKYKKRKKEGVARYYRTEAGRKNNIKANARYNKTEKGKKAVQRYRKTDKGKITLRAASSKRRSKIKKAIVGLTTEQEDEIKQIYKHCERVSKKLQIPFHVDHIVPLAKGGLHHPLNLQVVPAKWNLRKQDKHTEIWQGL
jgi:hypothetical protein